MRRFGVGCNPPQERSWQHAQIVSRRPKSKELFIAHPPILLPLRVSFDIGNANRTTPNAITHRQLALSPNGLQKHKQILKLFLAGKAINSRFSRLRPSSTSTRLYRLIRLVRRPRPVARRERPTVCSSLQQISFWSTGTRLSASTRLYRNPKTQGDSPQP